MNTQHVKVKSGVKQVVLTTTDKTSKAKRAPRKKRIKKPRLVDYIDYKQSALRETRPSTRQLEIDVALIKHKLFSNSNQVRTLSAAESRAPIKDLITEHAKAYAEQETQTSDGSSGGGAASVSPNTPTHGSTEWQRSIKDILGVANVKELRKHLLNPIGREITPKERKQIESKNVWAYAINHESKLQDAGFQVEPL